MKKKTLFFTLLFIVTLTVTTIIRQSKSNSQNEILLIANIEALTEIENTDYLANSALDNKSITNWKWEVVWVGGGEYAPTWVPYTDRFECCVQSNEYNRCETAYHSSRCRELSDSNIRQI